MEPLGKTFICWSKPAWIDTPSKPAWIESMDQDKLSFMYLKMTDDGMAEFYNDFQLKSMITSFKTEPFSSSSTDETLSFEADRSDKLLSKLKKLEKQIFQEEMDREDSDEDEDSDKDEDSDIAEISCIFLFDQAGTMGHVLYS